MYAEINLLIAFADLGSSARSAQRWPDLGLGLLRRLRRLRQQVFWLRSGCETQRLHVARIGGGR